MSTEPYKYILYEGRIYQARSKEENPYDHVDSNKNWIEAENNGRTKDINPKHGVSLVHPDDWVEHGNGNRSNSGVSALYKDLVFLRESDKKKYPELFI